MNERTNKFLTLKMLKKKIQALGRKMSSYDLNSISHMGDKLAGSSSLA